MGESADQRTPSGQEGAHSTTERESPDHASNGVLQGDEGQGPDTPRSHRAEPDKVRKPWLCRLKLHQWFLDSAWFYSADCCSRCGEYRDPYSLDRLMTERKLWEQVPEGLDMMKGAGWVAERLW